MQSACNTAIQQVIPYSKPYSNTAKKLLYGGHTAAHAYGFGCCKIQQYSNFPIQQPYSIQQPRPSLWVAVVRLGPSESEKSFLLFGVITYGVYKINFMI